MRGNNFKEKKVVPLIFTQFWIRTHLNQLDPLTPQDAYYVGVLYWTALSVKFLPSYYELIKSPHSQQVGIFAVHKFIEIDGMSHTVLGIHGTIEFQNIWWKFLYFSLSVELSKGWLQWLPKHFFFWQVFSFIFVSFKQDRTMSSIVKLEKINTKFVEDVHL